MISWRTDAAAHRDQEEEAPAQDPHPAHRVVDGRQVVERHVRDERVDLDRQPHLVSPFGRPHRHLEGAVHAAEAVVAPGVGAVEAQRDRLDPGRLERREALPRQVGGHRRRERGADPAIRGGPDELLEVRAAERVAAGEDDMRQRVAEAEDPVEEPLPLVGRQLERAPLGLGRGAAVAAGEAAGQRCLPVDEHRGAVVDESARLDGADAGQGAGMAAGMTAGMAAGMADRDARLAECQRVRTGDAASRPCRVRPLAVSRPRAGGTGPPPPRPRGRR